MRATFPTYLILLHFSAKILFVTDNEASDYAPSWIFSYPFTGVDKTLEVHEFETSRISKQSAHKGSKFVRPTHRPPLLPRHITGSNFSYTPAP
jgi:hypothetical protein